MVTVVLEISRYELENLADKKLSHEEKSERQEGWGEKKKRVRSLSSFQGFCKFRQRLESL